MYQGVNACWLPDLKLKSKSVKWHVPFTWKYQLGLSFDLSYWLSQKYQHVQPKGSEKRWVPVSNNYTGSKSLLFSCQTCQLNVCLKMPNKWLSEWIPLIHFIKTHSFWWLNVTMEGYAIQENKCCLIQLPVGLTLIAVILWHIQTDCKFC